MNSDMANQAVQFKPDVSVIIPVYNSGSYLKRCLESVIGQTHKNIEIICINDGSTDNSLEILTAFKQADDRIELINQKNHGLSYSRNVGLDAARGIFIYFLDADDYIDFDTLEGLLSKIGDCDAAFSEMAVEYDVLSEMAEKDSLYYSLPKEGIVNVSPDSLRSLFPSACSRLFRKQVIEDLSLRFPQGLHFEDNYWFWCYFSTNRDVYYLKQKKYHRIRRANSIMSKALCGESAFASDYVRICQGVLEFYRKRCLLKKNMAPLVGFVRSLFDSSLSIACQFEKSRLCYDFGLLIDRYQLEVQSDFLLKKVAVGDLSLVYPDSPVSIEEFYRYLRLKECVDRYLPKGCLLRKILLWFLKKLLG